MLKKILHFIKSDLSTLEKVGLGILILSHALAAYCSYGFHHPDEHFQILEFAHAYLGLSDYAHLPWEYPAQIRPWFQPFLHVFFMKAAMVLGIYDSFSMALFFRMVYAGLNVWMLFAIWRSFKTRFQLHDHWWIIVSSIWFFPYIHARTSSENLSGIFLSFAFLRLWKINPQYFAAGLLFGFSFLARAQIALGLVGLGIMLLIRDRKITRQHWVLLLGFLIPVALGVIIDRIAYGNWVVTAYRYFTVNLVQGVAATFNPYPWYQYFIWIVQLNPFISLPLFAGYCAYLWRYRTDLLSGFVFSFFFLHLFITNKEYRFLFPIIQFVPFMTAVVFSQAATPLFKKRTFWVSYAVISFIAFAGSALRGASIHFLWPKQAYHDYNKPGDHWISNRDFTTQTIAHYYDLTHVKIDLVTDAASLEAALEKVDRAKVLLDGKPEDQVTLDLLRVIEKRGCTIVHAAYPPWIFNYRSQFPILNRVTMKHIYDCKKQ